MISRAVSKIKMNELIVVRSVVHAIMQKQSETTQSSPNSIGLKDYLHSLVYQTSGIGGSSSGSGALKMPGWLVATLAS